MIFLRKKIHPLLISIKSTDGVVLGRSANKRNLVLLTVLSSTQILLIPSLLTSTDSWYLVIGTLPKVSPTEEGIFFTDHLAQERLLLFKLLLELATLIFAT